MIRKVKVVFRSFPVLRTFCFLFISAWDTYHQQRNRNDVKNLLEVYKGICSQRNSKASNYIQQCMEHCWIVQNELKSMELSHFFHILFFSSFAVVVFVLPKYQNKATVMYILSTLDSLSFDAIRITAGMSPYIRIIHDFQWSKYFISYKKSCTETTNFALRRKI